MTKDFECIEQTILAPSGLTVADIEQQLALVSGSSIDYSDFYFQYEESESWYLEDGIVKSGSYGIDHGVGVRVISGEKTGFAYADQIDLAGITRSAKVARGIVRSGHDGQVQALKPSEHTLRYVAANPLEALSKAEKVSWLREIDVLAREQDPRVEEVMASLSGSFETVLILATDGTLAWDVRPLVRVNVTVVAEQNGRREQGFSGGGGRYDFAFLYQAGDWRNYTKEAVQIALINLDAVDAPAGEMEVVLASGWPGVLLHEAFGHGLEGDFNRKKTSSFHHLMNQKVASELCTVVDDGTLADLRGSMNVDDEGTPSQCTTLVENGMLKNYMHDKHNARLMGEKSTGNARRQSYAHLTIPRMTNTFMLPGQSEPDEIIASVKKGLYAKNFSGGAVDITSGKFVFAANEAYLIEDGKITTPVKGATIIGDGPSALLQVDMVGNDLALDSGIGVCGKDGQSVPVGVGQPTLRINGLTVGGTA